MKFMAYFQSYTGTYSPDIDKLLNYYKEASLSKDIVGIIIGTRPDCINSTLLKALSKLNRHIAITIEYGAETSHDRTLELINRHHTWQCTVDAVNATVDAGLSCGIHLIAGLPGEEHDDILETVDRACNLPLESLKFHHLQIIRGTRLHQLITQHSLDVHSFSVDEYLDLCVEIVEHVPSTIAIERFTASAPSEMVVSPRWGLKNYEFTNLLLSKLKYRQRLANH
jgi:hypothetical protein